MNDQPNMEHLPILLRAYAAPANRAPKSEVRSDVPKTKRRGRVNPQPSPWVMVFDTETTTDPAQALRFGSYQVRSSGELVYAGIFYDDALLSPREMKVLTDYAASHCLELMTRETFVENVLIKIAYDLRAAIVGFNLPFDLSRIAIGCESARGRMRGGFSFQMTADKRRPRVQVKHLSQRQSLIQFTAPFRQRQARSQRRRGDSRPARRGFFVDVRTLASALFSRSFSLEKLSDFLDIDQKKRPSGEHGQALNKEYVDYAVRDVEATWQCYEELLRRYDALQLRATPARMIFSEASLEGVFESDGCSPLA